MANLRWTMLNNQRSSDVKQPQLSGIQSVQEKVYGVFAKHGTSSPFIAHMRSSTPRSLMDHNPRINVSKFQEHGSNTA